MTNLAHLYKCPHETMVSVGVLLLHALESSNVATVLDPDLKTGPEVKTPLFIASPSLHSLDIFNVGADYISKAICQLLCRASERVGREKLKTVESAPLDFRANLARQNRARRRQRCQTTSPLKKKFKTC